MPRYAIDRLVAGRRIRLPTEARTATDHRARLALFDRLVREGLYDWIAALEAGDVTWGDLLYTARQGTLHRPIAWVWLRKPLLDLLPTLPPDSRRRLRHWLTAVGVPLAQPLGALAGVDWARALAAWEHSGAHWNHGRRALSRLLTLLLGKQHPDRHQLLAPIPIHPERARAVTVRHEDVAGLISHAHPEDQPLLRFLTLTAVRVGEVGTCWVARGEPTFLVVEGTKTTASHRQFPIGPRTANAGLMNRCANLWTVRDRWARLRPVPLTLHDFRHIAIQAAEACGIPEGRRRQWSGHAPPTVHARYTQAAWTVEDALTLEAYWERMGLFTPRSTPQAGSPPIAKP